MRMKTLGYPAHATSPYSLLHKIRASRLVTAGQKNFFPWGNRHSLAAHSTLKSLASWHDFETCVMANGGSKKHIVPRFHHDSILEAVTGLKSEICVISTFISLKTRIFPPWTRVVLACIVKRWPIFPASKLENPGGLSKNSDRKKFITPAIPGKNSLARPAAIVRQSE